MLALTFTLIQRESRNEVINLKNNLNRIKVKTLSLLMMISLLLFGIFNVCAEEKSTSLDIDRAYQTMDSFINSNINMGDSEWNDFEIVSYENIYDVNLVHYGYVFELSNGIQDGYGIVVEDDGAYYVVESSNDTQSPYIDNNELNVYFTPLEYYSAPNAMVYSFENTLVNLTDGSTLSSTETKAERYEVNLPSIQPMSVPGESFKYISNYSTKFEKHQQTKSSSCIPASFAMSLKYLHNIGSLTLRSPYTNMDNIDNKLYELANCTSSMCYASNIKTAVQSFSDSYITGATIRTKDDEFQPDTYLSVAQDEVDGNCPPIIIFYKGALNTNPNSNHATTMVGYKTINNDSTGNVTVKTSYIVVADPWDKSTKTVMWSSSAVFGYMLIYFY